MCKKKVLKLVSFSYFYKTIMCHGRLKLETLLENLTKNLDPGQFRFFFTEYTKCLLKTKKLKNKRPLYKFLRKKWYTLCVSQVSEAIKQPEE